MNHQLGVALAAYVASIVAANVMTDHLGLVNVGFGLLVTAGTFAAGFALLARDYVHRYGGYRWALAAIGAGGLMSLWLASANLAAASTIAFLTAELADLGVFATVRPHGGFITAAVTSNLVSAPLDTVVFLWVAGFPLTWQTVTGQLIAKLVWATAIPLTLWAAAVQVRTA